VQRGLIIIVCLAIMSLVSAPTGFMPARGSDGALVLQICSGTNPRAITVKIPGSQTPDDAEQRDSCDYSTAAKDGLPQAAQPAPLAVIRPFVVSTLPAALTGIFPASLPPSTGPPYA